ncbi:ADP-ribose pyrophosphatase [Elusimicrobium simillimum]|uniref:NUDIX hydrolase n=1 Tax=Elusimicrobium simillimum TaxID=3143438 RepID=UPI003C705E77
MPKHYNKLKEVKLSGKPIFRGVVGFNLDTVKLINGTTATREYMVHPGASAVLPITNDGKVVLVQQYRYPVKSTTWEIPAGKAKKGQSPLACAKAELKEETGYSGKVKKLISFHPCCAFSDELLHVFIATDLKAGKTNPDEDEFLNVRLFPFKTALKMIEKGEIKDAKTIIALTMYKNMEK